MQHEYTHMQTTYDITTQYHSACAAVPAAMLERAQHASLRVRARSAERYGMTCLEGENRHVEDGSGRACWGRTRRPTCHVHAPACGQDSKWAAVGH
jgi:hypothetical protein